MTESSEIKLLKAKVALLETEKKHLIQKLASIEKQKTDKSTSKIVTSLGPPEENHYDFPVECFDKNLRFDSERSQGIEQKIQLLKNIFRAREDV